MTVSLPLAVMKAPLKFPSLVWTRGPVRNKYVTIFSFIQGVLVKQCWFNADLAFLSLFYNPRKSLSHESEVFSLQVFLRFLLQSNAEIFSLSSKFRPLCEAWTIRRPAIRKKTFLKSSFKCISHIFFMYSLYSCRFYMVWKTCIPFSRDISIEWLNVHMKMSCGVTIK